MSVQQDIAAVQKKGEENDRLLAELRRDVSSGGSLNSEEYEGSAPEWKSPELPRFRRRRTSSEQSWSVSRAGDAILTSRAAVQAQQQRKVTPQSFTKKV
eukprot:5673590-Pyramimonas_sp.AAC.1